MIRSRRHNLVPRTGLLALCLSSAIPALAAAPSATSASPAWVGTHTVAFVPALLAPRADASAATLAAQ